MKSAMHCFHDEVRKREMNNDGDKKFIKEWSREQIQISLYDVLGLLGLQLLLEVGGSVKDFD